MKLPRPTLYHPDSAAAPSAARHGGHAAPPGKGVVPAAYTMTTSQWMKYTDCLDEANMAYDCPAGRRDCFIYPKSAGEEGLRNFHVHEFSEYQPGPETVLITTLLPKSGSFRSGEQINLADETLDSWMALVAGMDASTRQAVAAMKGCFERVGAVYS